MGLMVSGEPSNPLPLEDLNMRQRGNQARAGKELNGSLKCPSIRALTFWGQFSLAPSRGCPCWVLCVHAIRTSASPQSMEEVFPDLWKYLCAVRTIPLLSQAAVSNQSWPQNEPFFLPNPGRAASSNTICCSWLPQFKPAAAHQTKASLPTQHFASKFQALWFYSFGPTENSITRKRKWDLDCIRLILNSKPSPSFPLSCTFSN